MGILSNFLKSYSEPPQQQAPPPATLPPQTTGSSLIKADEQASAGSSNDASVIPATSVFDRTSPATSASEIERKTLYQNPRARTIKQVSLFLAGATFLTASTLITRRAITRKFATIKPKFYTPSNFKPTDANGAVEAAEAFALATINVGSLAMMLVGGSMFALDVVDAEDLREKYKAKMGFQDNLDQTADAEIEEWVKGVLDKKDSGDYRGMTEGLTALVGVLAGKEEDKDKLDKLKEEGVDKSK